MLEEGRAAADLEHYRFRVPEQSGGRLDSVAADLIDISSRNQLKQRLVSAQLNGRAARLSSRVREGDSVELTVRPEELPDLKPEPVDFDLLHREASFAVINKPAGLVVHPAPGHPSGTLVNGLLHRFGAFAAADGQAGGVRPGVVHRLDRDTSGVMVVALTAGAHTRLALQFYLRSVEKTYVAIVRGIPPQKDGELGGRLIRDPRNRQRFASAPDGSEAGKPMFTSYDILADLPDLKASLLLLRPRTGRTHQLRVQLAGIGCPILGDPVYGGPTAQRMMLHALELEFDNPDSGERLRFRAPPPRALLQLLPEIHGLPD